MTSNNQDNKGISGRDVGQWIQWYQRNGMTNTSAAETRYHGCNR